MRADNSLEKVIMQGRWKASGDEEDQEQDGGITF